MEHSKKKNLQERYLQNKDELIKAFDEEWSNITPDICQNLVESMSIRLKRVIQAKGDVTNY